MTSSLGSSPELFLNFNIFTLFLKHASQRWSAAQVLPFCCEGKFRRLRAASDFARGGSSSQSPLHSVSAWRRKLRSFPCSSSSRRTRFAGLRREQRGIGQNAAGDGSDEHFVLIVAFPRTPGTGDALLIVSASFPARKTRSACLRFNPGPLGPCVGKIFRWCGSRTAPGFAEPTCRN